MNTPFNEAQDVAQRVLCDIDREGYTPLFGKKNFGYTTSSPIPFSP